MAIVGPTPSAAASSSSVAAMIRSIERKSRASAWAAVGPTCRMDSADEHPPQRDVLAASRRLVSSLAPLAERVPSFFVKNDDRCSCSSSRKKMSPSSCEQAALQQRDRPPRSRGSRCRRHRGRRRGRRAPGAGPGRTGRWGTGCRRRPPSPAAARCRTRGSGVGMTNSRSDAVARRHHRAEHLGDDVAGLADDDGVADQDALALDLADALCRVASWTVEPATFTGSMNANGRDPAGAADVDPDVEELGRRLLRRVLERDRPRGARARWSRAGAAGRTGRP